jgi:hypothetical protein
MSSRKEQRERARQFRLAREPELKTRARRRRYARWIATFSIVIVGVKPV